MNGPIWSALTDRALIRLAGEDARPFLQNLVTCEIDHLGTGEAAFGALLTPQGKILFDFFVIATDDGFLVDTARNTVDDLVKRLKFYKLRAKVTVEPGDDATGIYACWGSAPAASDGIAVADPRHAALGWRLYATQEPAGEAGDYEAHRIALGMPDGGRDFDYGDAFPHEALMDQNGGVDFAKGCFVGQEVVSRMQHRGTARKRIVQVEAETPLPGPGTGIEAGGKPIGTMGSAHDKAGLAMIRLDRAGAAIARGDAVTAGETTLTIRLQPWVGFDWPDRAA